MYICYDCCGTTFDGDNGTCPNCGQECRKAFEPMRVMILGWDGYLGYPLIQHLAARGHEVAGIDALLRRNWVKEMGGHSAIPIASADERETALISHFEIDRYGYYDLGVWRDNLLDYRPITDMLRRFQPEAIVHLAECPSAPYSMIDAHHAGWVQYNNIVGTLNILFAMHEVCPGAHLLKLGTMGEYGTPNIDIPEGTFEVEYRGRKDTLPFPRQAGSFYHLSKVHDTHNVTFACKTWGLRSTDIMQGVVYGTRTDTMADDPRLWTRLDFDECFGTVINRFCCQAVVGEPITPFGTGTQQRGFLPLRDSIQCMTLAIENPPGEGEYRTFNQFEETYTILELAEMVKIVADSLSLNSQVKHLENPRTEAEKHYYNPDRQHLLDLGYQPTHDMEAELRVMLTDLMPHRARIEAKREKLIPEICWTGQHGKAQWR